MRVTVSIPALGLLAACQPAPVRWDEAAERQALVPATSVAVDSIRDATLGTVFATPASGARMLPSGGASFVSPTGDAPPAPPAPTLNALAAACPRSVRVAVGRGGERVAAWWALRPSGRALLLASRSGDAGATWETPTRVDTLDVATSGCDRPAPAVAVDSANGYAHVAYSIEAPEGTGVFYAHRMGPSMPFEAPRVIIYGDHVTPVSVASAGMRVVVGYEDPNTGGRPYVSLALSRSAGHLWDERFAVSSGAESATRPAVALRGRQVAVGWMVPASPTTLLATDDPYRATIGGGVVVVRVGELR